LTDACKGWKRARSLGLSPDKTVGKGKSIWSPVSTGGWGKQAHLSSWEAISGPRVLSQIVVRSVLFHLDCSSSSALRTLPRTPLSPC